MTVAEMIVALQQMPQAAEAGYVWDGAYRSDVMCVFLSRSGVVLLSDENDVLCYDEDRPLEAPTQEENPSWCASDNHHPITVVRP